MAGKRRKGPASAKQRHTHSYTHLHIHTPRTQQIATAAMSEAHHNDALHAATQVGYAAFDSQSPVPAQSSPQIAPKARGASASRMTWGYWFVRGMFKIVIRLFMCAPQSPPSASNSPLVFHAASHVRRG